MQWLDLSHYGARLYLSLEKDKAGRGSNFFIAKPIDKYFNNSGREILMSLGFEVNGYVNNLICETTPHLSKQLKALPEVKSIALDDADIIIEEYADNTILLEAFYDLSKGKPELFVSHGVRLNVPYGKNRYIMLDRLPMKHYQDHFGAEMSYGHGNYVIKSKGERISLDKRIKKPKPSESEPIEIEEECCNAMA